MHELICNIISKYNILVRHCACTHILHRFGAFFWKLFIYFWYTHYSFLQIPVPTDNVVPLQRITKQLFASLPIGKSSLEGSFWNFNFPFALSKIHIVSN